MLVTNQRENPENTAPSSSENTASTNLRAESYMSPTKLEFPSRDHSGWFYEKLSNHLGVIHGVIPVNAHLAFFRSEAKLEVFLSQHMNTYEQKEMLIDCSDWTFECVLIQFF